MNYRGQHPQWVQRAQWSNQQHLHKNNQQENNSKTISLNNCKEGTPSGNIG
jgi:hypothetical protein